MKLLLFILWLCVPHAHARVIWIGECALFTPEPDDVTTRVCNKDLEKKRFFKADKPLVIDDRTWDLVARVSSPYEGVVSRDNNTVTFLSLIKEHPALDDAGYKQTHNKVLKKGFLVSFFGADGGLRWSKTYFNRGEPSRMMVSGDGSLALLLLKPYKRRNGKRSKFGRAYIFDAVGKNVLVFPPTTTICRLPSLTGTWISGTGEYVMLNCTDPETLLFLQPRSRYYFRNNGRPKISIRESGESVYITYPRGIPEECEWDPDECGRKDMDLSEAEWLSLEYLK